MKLPDKVPGKTAFFVAHVGTNPPDRNLPVSLIYALLSSKSACPDACVRAFYLLLKDTPSPEVGDVEAQRNEVMTFMRSDSSSVGKTLVIKSANDQASVEVVAKHLNEFAEFPSSESERNRTTTQRNNPKSYSETVKSRLRLTQEHFDIASKWMSPNFEDWEINLYYAVAAITLSQACDIYGFRVGTATNPDGRAKIDSFVKLAETWKKPAVGSRKIIVKFNDLRQRIVPPIEVPISAEEPLTIDDYLFGKGDFEGILEHRIVSTLCKT